MENKTAMQQMISQLKTEIRDLEEAQKFQFSEPDYYKLIQLEECKSLATELLEVEKKNIVEAYQKGCQDTYGNDEPSPIDPDDENAAEGYYFTKFNNQK